MSSSCTGAYTAEVAAALLSNVVNSSGSVSFTTGLMSESCHELQLAINSNMFGFS